MNHSQINPIFGYNYEPITSQLIENKSESAIIILIYEWFIEGYSKIGIVDRLNESGFLSRRGNQWTNITVSKVLVPERLNYYFGLDRSCKDAQQPKIISSEMYYKVKEELNRLNLGRKNSKPQDYLLSNLGVLICGYCGSTVKSSVSKQDNKVFAYYLCTQKQMRGSRKCEHSKLHQQNKINNLVVDNLSKLGFDISSRFTNVFYRLYTEFQPQIALLQLPDNEETTLNFNFGDKLESEMESLLTQVKLLKGIKQINTFKQLSLPEQRAIIKTFIKSIKIDNDELEITFNIKDNNSLITIVEKLL